MKHLLSFGLISLAVALGALAKEPEPQPIVVEPTEVKEVVNEEIIASSTPTTTTSEVETKEDEKEDYKGEWSSTACSCIQTAKAEGVNIPAKHNAWDLEPNSSIPVVGQLVLMQYKHTSHVAVLREIREDGYLIYEGNYKPCEYGTRLIPKDYYALTGFWVDSATTTVTVPEILATSTLSTSTLAK